MIKYTILYKNGKTWNGKAKGIANIPVVPCILLVIHCKDGARKLYYTDGYSWEHFEEMNPSHVYKRSPNPKSKTKKQKAFDEAYAEWLKTNNKHGDYFYYERTGKQAYKKWLYEEAKSKKVTFVKPVETPVDITISWDRVYKPWRESAIEKFHKQVKEHWKFMDEAVGALSNKPTVLCTGNTWKELGLGNKPEPIKTTYTFWLGALGELVEDKGEIND